MLILSVQSILLNDSKLEDLLTLLLSKIPDATVRFVRREDVNHAIFNKNNPVLLITQDTSLEALLSMQENSVLVWKNLPDLASKLDIFLQLMRTLSQFPLSIKGLKLKEVLSNSENALIYRAVNRKGESVAIKRFKFLPRSLNNEKIEILINDINRRCVRNSNGLVRLYNGGVTDQTFYFVMEYLEYGTLRQALDGCGNELPLVHALSWFQEIVLALECVHSVGLIHRNLKISKVLMRKDGSLALTDYGVSNRILLESGFLLEHELYCSPHYVSPEQISGDACTKVSDIYSLGVILYELLTGVKPYSAQESYALMMHHVMAPVPLLPQELSQFQGLINKMMAKNPDDRFSSAIDAIEFLPVAA